LGQPPQAYDAVLPFKILVLQTLDNLVEEKLEYLTRDRISFTYLR
jgi:transposase, IS5 family